MSSGAQALQIIEAYLSRTAHYLYSRGAGPTRAQFWADWNVSVPMENRQLLGPCNLLESSNTQLSDQQSPPLLWRIFQWFLRESWLM